MIAVSRQSRFSSATPAPALVLERQRGSWGKEPVALNFSVAGSPPHLASDPRRKFFAPNDLSITLFHSHIHATEGHPSRPLPAPRRICKTAPKNKKLSFKTFQKPINSPNFFRFFHLFSRIVRVFHAAPPPIPNPKQPPKNQGKAGLGSKSGTDAGRKRKGG
jgi:hypothetical protein